MKIFDKIEIEIDKQKLQTAIIAMSAMIIGYYLQKINQLLINTSHDKLFFRKNLLVVLC